MVFFLMMNNSSMKTTLSKTSNLVISLPRALQQVQDLIFLSLKEANEAYLQLYKIDKKED